MLKDKNTPFLPYLIIISSSIILLLLLISNPGHYSHDELQKLDYMLLYGFKNYMQEYLSIPIGSEFGSPVRPFSFMIQGFYALLMENYSFVVHLLDVLTHALIASLLYKLIIQFNGSKKLALLSALIFIINPMTIISVGWSAALMDRHYILFALITLIFADLYIRVEAKKIYLVFILLGSSLSILSKETALVLPSFMLLFLFVKFDYIKTKRFWIVSIIWSTPVIAFFLHRLPALIISFGEPKTESYHASILNFPHEILVYFSYPFLINLTDAGIWIFLDSYLLWIAVVIHIFILIAIWFKFGVKFIFYYLFFYFIPLLPVLFLPYPGSHYLYGSGVVFSIALASMLLSNKKNKIILKTFGSVILLVIIAHSYYLQKYVYDKGVCMNKIILSMESAYLSSSKPTEVLFKVEPSSGLLYVLNSTISGRSRIGNTGSLKLKVLQWNEKVESNKLLLIMTPECIVYSH